VGYSIGFRVSDGTALETPKINISDMGYVPLREQGMHLGVTDGTVVSFDTLFVGNSIPRISSVHGNQEYGSGGSDDGQHNHVVAHALQSHGSDS